jgi:hypothetical protein
VPFTSKGSAVCALAERPRRAKSSRCMAEEMTPGVPPRPRSFCMRSTSQAPPEVMPTNWVSGRIKVFTPFSSSL